jgi:enolase
MSPFEYMQYIKSLREEFNLFSIEDPFAEDDWETWAAFTAGDGNNVHIVGDDLLVTNTKRLAIATEKKACNSILVKVNQIGSLTETFDVIRKAREAQFTVIISHRSGETTDDFIADLAVGVGADMLKSGAPARGERVAKYNRLLQIYRQLSP